MIISENYYLCEIRNNISGLTVPDDAWAAQKMIMDILLNLRYSCTKEYDIKYKIRNKVLYGRIDILAVRGRHIIGIEIDNINPRQKSIDKLNYLFDHGLINSKIIILRNGKKKIII
jgi:hypothetical protein